MPTAKQIDAAYKLARERYESVGVNADKACAALAKIPVSLHCWQGDDVGGFENQGGVVGGGLAVTGDYPGRARTPDELRSDLDAALAVIPGRHRLNLHAFYGEFGGTKVDRDQIDASHFANWIAWAKSRGVGLDFNPTCFSHPKAADGFTLSHADRGIRKFWVEHCRRSREIGAAMGKALGTPCVTNVWVPDGFKDTPADRLAPRERLAESLDAVFEKPLSPKHNLDAVEPKLFGIGSESCTVGSGEFYLGYCITRKKLLCLDAGHYHPTESISDKISSVLVYLPEILLHVSRGVRWDSDHVVTLGRLHTADLWALLTPTEGTPRTISFVGIVFFAWFCNAAMHIGMADLSVLRFAKKPSAGWASASGMFLGHYVAWICAALLLIYWVRQHGVDPQVGKDPGTMVNDAVGWAGLICVIIAGWTTANPTIYRAGLAFQAMIPGMSRVATTMLAGGLCIAAGVFPAFAMNLLDFVGIYGTILAPVSAIIVVDHFFADVVGIPRDPAERSGSAFNTSVPIAWLVAVAVAMWLYKTQGTFASYLPLPCAIACGLIYIVLSKMSARDAIAVRA